MSFIDEQPLSGIHILVASLCGLVAMLDGFDVQSIAFAAPAIAKEWGVPADRFGLVFSAGLLGMLAGVALQGPVADRIGRKPVIVASVATFGIFSLLLIYAASLAELVVLRFLAGIGMGAAVPNFIALTSEYAPTRVKARMIVAMNAGFPLGGFIGGATSAYLLEAHGWKAIFLLGGVGPLLLVPVLIAFLPESVLFSAERARRMGEELGGQRTMKLLRAMGAKDEVIDLRMLDWSAKGQEVKPRLGAIFSDGRVAGTLCLWAAYFCSLILFYFLVSWLPTILTQAGLSQEMAVVAAAILNFGSVIGGLSLGWLADRAQISRILAMNYAIAGISCVLFGLSLESGLGVVTLLAIVLGFCCGGGQLMLNALGAVYYPTAIRATGLGAAGMAGRLGSLVGPIAGGVIIGAGASMATLFAVLIVPAAATSLSVSFIRARSS